MRLPAGIEVKGDTAKIYVLKLLKNHYGERQTEKVWVDYFSEKLMEETSNNLM